MLKNVGNNRLAVVILNLIYQINLGINTFHLIIFKKHNIFSAGMHTTREFYSINTV